MNFERSKQKSLRSENDNKTFCETFKVIAIYFNLRTATLIVVQKFYRNPARTHGLGAITIFSFSENLRIFGFFLPIGS
jgi:hypothetical protein